MGEGELFRGRFCAPFLNPPIKTKVCPHTQQSHLISEKGEMVKSICFDAPWRSLLGDESGEPGADLVYAKLTESGYTGIALGSVDEKTGVL